MSYQNTKWVERAGACGQDLVDMGRHFQMTPDCDTRNLHLFDPHNSISTHQRPPRTISISLDLLEFNLKLFLVAKRLDTLYLVAHGMTRS